MARPRDPIYYCECGNEKPRTQVGCDTCRDIDHQRPQPFKPKTYDPYGGPTSMHIADFQCSHGVRPPHFGGRINYGGDVGADVMKIAETVGSR